MKCVSSNIVYVDTKDKIIHCNCIANNINVYINATSGTHTIKKVDDSANTVTINAIIDGNSNYVLSNENSYVTLEKTDDGWTIIDENSLVYSQLSDMANNQSKQKQITERGCVYVKNLSTGADIGSTYRLKYKVISDAYDIRLVFSNFYDKYEGATPNDIIVKASVEIASVLYPIKFNGNDQITIKPKGYVISDEIGIELKTNDIIYVRTYVSVSELGQKWPLGLACVSANGEGKATEDLTTSGTVTASTAFAYHPNAIVGITSKKAVLLVGDSIVNGSNEVGLYNQGFAVRALQGNKAYLSLAEPGEKASDFLGLQRATRTTLLKYGDYAICNYGINDLLSSPSFATLQQSLQLIWNTLNSRGIKVYQCTITPNTTSTDTWGTTTNQTTKALETVRVQINDWIRTLPTPIVGIYDNADVCETSRNSGIWKAGYTNDGTHPITTAHIAMSANIDVTKFV